MILRYRYAFVCSLLVLFGIVAAIYLQRASHPIFKSENLIHDFGNVPAGGNVKYAFKFKNTGYKPLIIKNIQVSCGCVNDAHVNHQTVLPGKTELLHISWDSPGYETVVQENITLTTNEVQNKTHVFTIKANVETNYDVTPSTINFGIVEVGNQPQPLNVILSPKANQKAVTLKATSSNPDIKTFVSKKKDNTWKISMVLDKDAPIGPLIGDIFLTSPLEENKRLPITGIVIGEFRTQPAEIYQKFNPNEKGMQKIQIDSNNSSQPTVSLLDTSVNIKDAVHTVIDKNVVTVKWDTSSITAKETKGYLLFNLTTNSKSQKLIVPVTFVSDK